MNQQLRDAQLLNQTLETKNEKYVEELHKKNEEIKEMSPFKEKNRLLNDMIDDNSKNLEEFKLLRKQSMRMELDKLKMKKELSKKIFFFFSLYLSKIN